MSRRARGAWCAAVLLVPWLLTPPQPLAAQGVGAGVRLQHVRFGDAQAAGLERFELISAPFAASATLGPLRLDVSGAWARGRATGPEGGEAELSGITDTDVGVSLELVPGHVVLTAAATAPTGTSSLTLDQSVVAGVVAAELLPFAVTAWGTGGGFGGDVALAAEAGGWALGLAGGYRAARSYAPLAGESFAYRPGDMVRVRLAADHGVGRAGTFSLAVGAQRYGDDALDQANLFRSGTRVDGTVSLALPIGLRGSALLYGGVYHRSNGRLLVETAALDGATDSPAQDLFLAGASFRAPLGRRAVLLPEVEGRAFRTQDGVGQGWLGSAGAALDVRVAGRAFGARGVLTPAARVRFGRVTAREGAESALTGWDVSLSFRVEAGR